MVVRKIRQSFFETNSSSVHGICVSTGENNIKIPGSIYFGFDEFGWEIRKFNSIEEKASYLYTGFCSSLREEDFINYVKNVLEDDGIKVECASSKYEKNSYMDDEGKIHEYNYFDSQLGYINHGDELEEFLDKICNDKSKLYSFLFSPFSFIVTGNDNLEEDEDNEFKQLWEEDVKDGSEIYWKGN